MNNTEKIELYDDMSGVKNLFTKEQLTEFSNNINKWQPFCADNKEMYADDRKGLKKILKAIKNNDYKKASLVIHYFDSDPRGIIPLQIRNTIDEFYDGTQLTFEQIKQLFA